MVTYFILNLKASDHQLRHNMPPIEVMLWQHPLLGGVPKGRGGFVSCYSARIGLSLKDLPNLQKG